MEREHLEELWLRRLDGTALADQEAGELLAHFSSDEKGRAEFLQDEQFHGLLQSFARSKSDGPGFARLFTDRLAAEADAGPFVKKFQRRIFKEERAARARPGLRRTFWAAGLAAASVVLVLTAYMALRSASASVAELRDATGEVRIVRGSEAMAAAMGTRLAPQDILRVPTGASARVGYAGEQTMLALEPRTEAKIWDEDGDKRIQLISGSLTADVAPQPAGRPLVLLTPHLRVEVVGTRFSLAVDDGGTFIEMEHGKVNLRRAEDGKTLELSAGQFAEVRTGVEFAAQALTKSGTVEFQEGLSGYAGTQDLSISTQGINPNGIVSRSGKDLGVWRVETTNREKYEIRAFLRFTSISIPRRARVASARLSLAVDIWSPGWQLNGYYLKTSWNAALNSGLGWLYRDQGQAWAEPGAKGDGTDVLAGKHFSIESATGRGTENRSVELDPAVVQSWLDEPSNNHGILLVNLHPDHAIRVSSSRSQDATNRPKLEITWSR